MIDEPVRGHLPDPHLYALSGLDLLYALGRRRVPLPIMHLTGAGSTTIEPGSVVGAFPEVGWYQFGDGTVDIRFVCACALISVGITMAPPATKVRLRTLAVDDLRSCTLKGKGLTVRSRLVHHAGDAQIAEATVDDARGRTVGRAAGRLLLEPLETPAPVKAPPPGEAPIYTTPDPYLRPVRYDPVASPEEVEEKGGWLGLFSAIAQGALPHPPICELFGMRVETVGEGFVTGRMEASGWLVCYYPNDVFEGYFATFAHLLLSVAAGTLLVPGQGLQVLAQTLSFLNPVRTDGRDVTARASVTHEGDLLVSTVEMTDADGRQVLSGSQTSRPIVTARREPASGERVFATVLFTDIVGSTETAERLGDAAWRELLDKHHQLVRDSLRTFKGREIKTTGDGFLTTFDAPSRAVQCARTIRDGVRRLGLEIRAGLHAGECELVGGDIAGLTVHVASRVQAVAGPGEILVSGTVRDLTSGSGVRYGSRGTQQLKGIEGDWALFAVDG